MKAASSLTLFSMVLIALFVGASASPAQTLDFQNYNAIIFNNLNTTSDIEGRTFVGNDFTGSNSANLGNHLPNGLATGDRSFVVGNNLVSGNPLNLQRGSLYIDGSTNGRIINFNGGGSVVVDHGIDAQLSAIKDYSISQSMALQSLAADSIVTLPSGGQPGPTKFMATAGADGVAVFHVNAADIFSNSLGQQFELIADAQTTSVVINVSGTSVNWTNGNMVGQFTSNYWQGNVMWNFYEATTINLNSFNFNGAILAPEASITTRGNIDGLVVANNLTTSAEVHLPDSNSATPYAFDGYTAPVPEPGGAIFLVAAAGVILITRNRRLWV
ncbi:choice-of-anchor A domain-containing protein [Prosthecobacter fusiformis]|uniref:Choice-of-anchor A domain-containing protein n=1 Tax=Prosthecobacter fusiformis TaxID=48464 RepID=A0A4R7RHU5_9BACT|nr:choice-of-anchor A family protein [Prosthecobacter fusiformis]TDU62461.1 choice-of-anchor A domain-containing protein [Prosthecobacter fusiformis]